ncbi:hypothetical protein ACA910_020815 [Epithemia clementina (nom. ined.)]
MQLKNGNNDSLHGTSNNNNNSSSTNSMIQTPKRSLVQRLGYTPRRHSNSAAEKDLTDHSSATMLSDHSGRSTSNGSYCRSPFISPQAFAAVASGTSSTTTATSPISFTPATSQVPTTPTKQGTSSSSSSSSSSVFSTSSSKKSVASATSKMSNWPSKIPSPKTPGTHVRTNGFLSSPALSSVAKSSSPVAAPKVHNFSDSHRVDDPFSEGYMVMGYTVVTNHTIQNNLTDPHDEEDSHGGEEELLSDGLSALEWKQQLHQSEESTATSIMDISTDVSTTSHASANEEESVDEEETNSTTDHAASGTTTMEEAACGVNEQVACEDEVEARELVDTSSSIKALCTTRTRVLPLVVAVLAVLAGVWSRGFMNYRSTSLNRQESLVASWSPLVGESQQAEEELPLPSVRSEIVSVLPLLDVVDSDDVVGNTKTTNNNNRENEGLFTWMLLPHQTAPTPSPSPSSLSEEAPVFASVTLIEPIVVKSTFQSKHQGARQRPSWLSRVSSIISSALPQQHFVGKA